MELRHLRYFSVLADELHFGRAAQRLAISQPPLSVAIRQLEESIGARLFERNSKEVRLTAAGAALRESARQLLRRSEEIVREARDVASGSAGHLRIGFVGAMLYRGLPQALRAFRRRHAGVRISLTEMNSAEQMAELLHDRLDLGFVHTHRMPQGLQQRLLLTEPFVCCLPARHALARRRVVALADLQGQPFILFARSASPDYHERILSICGGAGYQPEVRHEVRHWLAVVSLVAQDMGVALVPEALRRSALKGAVFRPLQEAVAQSEAYGVWRSAPRNLLVERLLEEMPRALPPGH
ncbi:MAG: LysR family transcriptional regulator [Rhodocyclaceae bacterium]|nr:LysR family transcriptional regulator [Pseudomonadota bacterium]MDQ7971607.1 LysR family transcriptional regulator [Rhodocyclaceae bacterium]MDQ8001532.1 LysR family transcriptional regulator [Pseudomonadota bacterium]MDQ8018815.1 LysR family transcriptional regulator [Pseudomonadota bacterium]